MSRAVSYRLLSGIFRFFPGFIVLLSLHFFSTNPVQAQAINWPNEFDRCYALDWIYESSSTQQFMEQPRSNLLWYCQAKPKSASGFVYRQYQSYQEEWLDAIDFSILRCERGESEACNYRCALAPRVCAPHFWP